MTDGIKPLDRAVETEHMAQRALVSFLVTFPGARVAVFLIMSRRLPARALPGG